ncbi:MAG: WecB/TagA/CpsF family glycosyltransferase [Verrucomicrobiae bacterium]|nr:WecB/TagA/CpsF family glycosyltransferase [Verrucomicrobiae bacterium]
MPVPKGAVGVGAGSSRDAWVNVLGIGVSPITLGTATDTLLEMLENSRKGYVCVTSAHGITEALRDGRFKSILRNACLVTPDGMPLVWVGKMEGFGDRIGRVYGPDLMLEVFGRKEFSNMKHFFYGGKDGVAELLKQQLECQFPGSRIVGTYTPPFRPLSDEEAESLRLQVAEVKPDIIWVGLSTPKQEKFMAEYLGKLDTTLMIGVGAAFDFHSNVVRQAPRWMQRSGLEWLFRVCQEPRRLWWRYVKNNPLFLGRLLLQACGAKRYRLH